MKSKNKSVEDRSKAFEETMHDIFYNKAIRQRDSAWREIEELKDTIKELETKLKEIRNINDPWILLGSKKRKRTTVHPNSITNNLRRNARRTVKVF